MSKTAFINGFPYPVVSWQQNDSVILHILFFFLRLCLSCIIMLGY